MWCVVSPGTDPIAVDDVAGVLRLLRECHDGEPEALASAYRRAIAPELDAVLRDVPYVGPDALRQLLRAVQQAEAQAERLTGVRPRWPFVVDIRLNPWEAESLIAVVAANYRCPPPTDEQLIDIADAMSSQTISSIPCDERNARDMARAIYDSCRAPWQRESRPLRSGAIGVDCNGYALYCAAAGMLGGCV